MKNPTYKHKTSRNLPFDREVNDCQNSKNTIKKQVKYHSITDKSTRKKIFEINKIDKISKQGNKTYENYCGATIKTGNITYYSENDKLTSCLFQMKDSIPSISVSRIVI